MYVRVQRAYIDFIIHVEARDLSEFYEKFTKALFSYFLDLDFREAIEERTLRAEGEEEEDFLVSFLNELLYDHRVYISHTPEKWEGEAVVDI